MISQIVICTAPQFLPKNAYSYSGFVSSSLCPIDLFGLGCGKSRQLLFPHNLNSDVAKGGDVDVYDIQSLCDKDELGNLSSLRMFQLDQKQISGPIPISLANLPNVVHFLLDNNNLSGSLPLELSNTKNIEDSNSKVIFEVHKFCSDLAGNMFVGSIPSNLSVLPHLQRLSLEKNGLTSDVPSTIWEDMTFSAAAKLIFLLCLVGRNYILGSGVAYLSSSKANKLQGNPVCSNTKELNIAQFCGLEHGGLVEPPGKSSNSTVECKPQTCPTGDYAFEILPFLGFVLHLSEFDIIGEVLASQPFIVIIKAPGSSMSKGLLAGIILGAISCGATLIIAIMFIFNKTHHGGQCKASKFKPIQAISKQSDPTILNDQLHLFSVLPSREDNDFDCVDIYKQPALSHPLLKNHKIQIKDQVNVESEGCPSGKVPIQRTRSDRQFGHQFSKDFPDQHLHFATIDTIKNTTYHGATAGICIYEPRVQSNQYSMAQIWVQSGPIAEHNSIQAGWAVHPQLYGDYHARMTVRWTADGFKNTGCYNAQCPGYVQVHPHLRPGGLFEHTSIPGGTQYGFEVRIIQEQSSGNWWLITNTIRIGYWPKELFNHLGNGASVVRYGGTTSSPQGHSSPPMGNGKLPSGKSPFTAGFFQQVKLMDSNYKVIDLVASDIRGDIDAPRTCYDLFFFQIIASRGYVFGYGGPGGPSCNT
ncbi:hypothetical protein FNV43_RR08903 [Rhamnella rubrinervis]|uniref:Neprosin PEP catalytic domain-containing protein n=1 Tax=Rhamnella rubrinervis TaxID=2594499 RepID=A0A8K0MJT4_9ROSA|nr:hypothetical protein FNV43_RR08903 [Rhamnella rubrinervis]